MRTARLLTLVLTSTCLALVPTADAQSRTQSNNARNGQSAKGTQVQLSSTPRPLVFEPNEGQGNPQFQWIGRGAGFLVGIGSGGASIEFRNRSAAPPQRAKQLFPSATALMKQKQSAKAPQSELVKLHLAGSASWKPSGANPTGGISNYFIGKDASNWHTNIPQYAQVKVAAVYEGVDLIFHGNEGSLEYDFQVAPGADPAQIRLQFEGATSLQVDKATGDLVLTTTSGTRLRHAQPRMYQQVGGKKVAVKGGFEVLEGNIARFSVQSYDRNKPLIIDPTVVFTTFLGGSSSDFAEAVAVDGLGFTYVTGETESGNFNVVGGVIQTGKSGDSDAFVTKLGTRGNIVFSTFLGGGDTDEGIGIAVDASGVYVCGQTMSDDFPLSQPYQYQQKGDSDAFVTKLSPVGNRLVYSTYLGGTGGDWAAPLQWTRRSPPTWRDSLVPKISRSQTGMNISRVMATSCP